MHKKRKTKSKVQNTTAKNIAIKTAIGSGVSLVVFFLLALLAGFVLWKNDADTNSFKYIIFALSAVSGFIGGFVAVRPIRKNGIAFGALSSVVPCAIIILISVLIAKSSVSVTGWIFIALYILFSAIGGIVAVNKRK